jgi:prefoldin subunit 5
MKIDITKLAEFELKFSEINKCWEKDMEEATKALDGKKSEAEKRKKELLDILNGTVKKSSNQETDIKQEVYESEAVKNGITVKYLKQRIFPSKGAGYYIIEDGELVCKTKDTWAKFEKKIKAKCLKLFKTVIDDCEDLYAVDVYPEMDCIINTCKFKINLAQGFNYKYVEDYFMDSSDEDYYKNFKDVMSFIKEVICDNDDEQFKCLSYVLSCMLHMKQSQIVLFLSGLQGIGKTFFCDIIRMLLANGVADISEGHLNGEIQFNKHLIGAVCAVLEETDGSDHKRKLMRGLKDISTGQRLMARAMYADTYAVKNFINVVILSNYFNDIDVGERRVFPMISSNKKQGDTKYFSDLKKKLTPGCLQLVFNYFYEIDCETLIPPPNNQNKQDVKPCRIKSPIRFLIDEFMIKRPKKTVLKMSTAYVMYEQYCDASKGKQIKYNFGTFSHEVREYIECVREDGKQKISSGSPVYDFCYKDLHATIIVRSKVITDADLIDLSEMIASKRTIRNIELIEAEENKYEEIIETKDKQISQLEAKIQELEKLLKEKEQPKPVKKTAKITNSLSWANLEKHI